MKILIILVVLLAAGAGAWFYFGAPEQEPPEPSVRVALLVNPPAGNKSITPHTVEKETHFKESLKYLAPGSYKPEVYVDASASGSESESGAGEISYEGASIPDVQQDWTGLVLVPYKAVVSKAYNSSIKMPRVEAHPLIDDRLRVWTTLRNITDVGVEVDVSCAFKYGGGATRQLPFQPILIPAGEEKAIAFESTEAGVEAYTILVR